MKINSPCRGRLCIIAGPRRAASSTRAPSCTPPARTRHPATAFSVPLVEVWSKSSAKATHPRQDPPAPCGADTRRPNRRARVDRGLPAVDPVARFSRRCCPGGTSDSLARHPRPGACARPAAILAPRGCPRPGPRMLRPRWPPLGRPRTAGPRRPRRRSHRRP